MWTWVSWYQTSASMSLFWEMSEWWENISILDFIVAKWWSYKTCKAPVKLSPSTNQHLAFYRPDALPVTQPTVSKHWMEYTVSNSNVHSHHTSFFQLLFNCCSADYSTLGRSPTRTFGDCWCRFFRGWMPFLLPNQQSFSPYIHSKIWSSPAVKCSVRQWWNLFSLNNIVLIILTKCITHVLDNPAIPKCSICTLILFDLQL